MNDCEINDIRGPNEFKGITFSNFKKIEAKKVLLNSLKEGKIEAALNWSAEYICCGAFIDLWDILLNFLGKHIHLGNPKLPIYINLRFNNFKEIIQNGYIGFEINMRNNNKIRKLFAEIISIICLSSKKHAIESININKAVDFDMTNISSKFKAPDVSFGNNIFKKDDPKELFVGINELMFHLSKQSLNSLEACYWMEWILDFETLCKKKKQNCICERRSFVNVEEKFQKSCIWMIWDCFFYTQKNRHKCEIIEKILKSLFDLFCIKYTSGVNKKRKYLLYFAISLLTEKFNKNINIIANKESINNIVSKIDLTYKLIKKNEISPQTDYLFNGLKKNSQEKTIEKLEILNKMNNFNP